MDAAEFAEFKSLADLYMQVAVAPLKRACSTI